MKKLIFIQKENDYYYFKDSNNEIFRLNLFFVDIDVDLYYKDEVITPEELLKENIPIYLGKVNANIDSNIGNNDIILLTDRYQNKIYLQRYYG